MEYFFFYENDLAVLEANIKNINALVRQLSSKAKKVSWKHLKKVADNSIIFAVMNCSMDVIGIATLTKAWKLTGFFGTMEDVIVDENYREKGVGSKLIKLILKKAKKLGMSYVDLTSNPERVEANKLYQRLGAKKRETNVYRFTL